MSLRAGQKGRDWREGQQNSLEIGSHSDPVQIRFLTIFFQSLQNGERWSHKRHPHLFAKVYSISVDHFVVILRKNVPPFFTGVCRDRFWLERPRVTRDQPNLYPIFVLIDWCCQWPVQQVLSFWPDRLMMWTPKQHHRTRETFYLDFPFHHFWLATKVLTCWQRDRSIRGDSVQWEWTEVKVRAIILSLQLIKSPVCWQSLKSEIPCTILGDVARQPCCPLHHNPISFLCSPEQTIPFG